ncbi:MAG: acyl-CoA thioester hydrolase [Actinomycetota bacterium]|jgi:acyl-CoA thioester hydrolase|nr:acyl-CoA thioester hydrolase [Actinomycetota bacterium]
MTDHDPVFRLQVYRRFSDLDPLGHVNNVVFYDYLQEARVQLLQKLGFMQVEGFSLVVVKQEMTYRKPLLLSPEPITIESWVNHIGNSSFTFHYRIHDEVGDLAAVASTVLAAVDLATGRPVRLNPELRAALLELTIDR